VGHEGAPGGSPDQRARRHHRPHVVREPKGFRSPGLHIPGVAAVGTFHHDGEKTLWQTCRGTGTIVIQLTGRSYDGIAVEVPNPREAVKLINKSLPRRPQDSQLV
jgi:hypothetical protein